MASHFKAGIVVVGLMIPLLHVSALAAEKPKPAPIPAQILVAKKVFVANAGGDEPIYDGPFFNGGPDRAYNQLYAAMKTPARYELVGAPADADLLVEIRFTVPRLFVPRGEVNAAGEQPLLGPPPYDPQLRLEIRDPKTNALLWAFTEHVQWAILQGNRDKNFDQALAKIAGDLPTLGGEQATGATASKP